MKRRDLQNLAILPLKEAKILLRSRVPDGAYYLGGYCVECAIKACIAKQTQRFEFPDKEKANASYDHNISKLLKVAGLDQAVEQEAVPEVAKNWKIVGRWNEKSRYERRSYTEAEALLTAIGDRRNGILRWLKLRW
jgi:hypothetical protein